MKEFKINDYITLKLEGTATNLYLNEVLFEQCKYILFSIPVDQINSFDKYNSIDEIASKLDHSMSTSQNVYEKITPETG